MYFFTTRSCDLLTVNTPYPSCQANEPRAGKVSCTHFEERALTVRIRSALGQGLLTLPRGLTVGLLPRHGTGDLRSWEGRGREPPPQLRTRSGRAHQVRYGRVGPPPQ